MEFYLTALLLGLCLSAMSIGIFMTMKIFNIPDITTDGSYTLGAVVTATLLTGNVPPYFIIPAVLAAGALAGAATGLIHTRLKVDALLSGIIVMTGLYSINLVILGRSNVPLINVPTLFSLIHIAKIQVYNDVIMGIICLACIVAIIAWLLVTDFGIAMRATGNSPTMTRALGINNNTMKIIGLSIANALTAFSGYLVCQYQGFTDINMGMGIVITGLGTVSVGFTLQKWLKTSQISIQLLLIIVGSILLQMVLAFALSMGIDPNLLKLITALFVLAIVYLPSVKLNTRS
jgi:putative ABC transport system permease protein